MGDEKFARNFPVDPKVRHPCLTETLEHTIGVTLVTGEQMKQIGKFCFTHARSR